ncbi:hypothetical protein I3842_02G146700 [Carya illinoinensis]|uniref:non-specific serine/threonine protein kinase n=1 Tax=Carya illinoinensis TaxID=32201 RepID=A0A922K1J4_CARIL|nr:hypothetical protein I3842_02G146700 [Carya illinoinensis]KAG6727895.1 hypothetical protein I3842_02G146700 [Carya illinoinensis]
MSAPEPSQQSNGGYSPPPPPPTESTLTPSPTPSPTDEYWRRTPNGSYYGRILFNVVIVMGVLIVTVAVGFCVTRRRKKRRRGDNKGSDGLTQGAEAPPGFASNIQQFQAPSPRPHPSLMQSILDSEEPSPRPCLDYALRPSQISFSYEELSMASDQFSDANLLGEGGFGFVHKGVLPNGKEVAIKHLKSESVQGDRELGAEVEIISRVHHKNLVSLVGYCVAGAQRMLVYEFIPNFTLNFHLHGKARPVMNWPTRMKIALGSAKGLAYLHEDCHPKIIHRDIKAANILLDDNFDAKVADFGLAKFSADTDTHISTRVMGTFGYLAPDYAASGKLTIKSDVFSFGVVLLELITGRQPHDKTQSFHGDSMVEWARPLLMRALENGNFDALVDPRLHNGYNSSEMSRMATCAAACVSHSARQRPRMSVIVRVLEGNLSLDDLNEGIKPEHSRAFGSDQGRSQYNQADMNKFWKMALESQEQSTSESSGPA